MTRQLKASSLVVKALLLSVAFLFSGLQLNAETLVQTDRRQEKVNNGQKAAERSRQEGILSKLHDAGLNGRIPVPYRPEAAVSLKKPQTPPAVSLSPFEREFRTGKSRFILQTEFETREEAYAFVSSLAVEQCYDIDTYDISYCWFETSWHLIPTAQDWVRPYCPNQFRIHFEFDRYKGGVRIVVTAIWRESVLSKEAAPLFYQPSADYSTSYAWNVLEHFSVLIPHTDITFE